MVRGVDFDSVSAVLLFSLPQTVEDLLHLQGRTGRGENERGMCICLLREDAELEGNELRDFL